MSPTAAARGAASAAADLVRAHRGIEQPTTFRLLGREWDLLPGVYAPGLTPSAALYAEWLPYPAGGSFCEVGSGTGYLAVTAALRGCARVTALDVAATAVENTRRNAARHGVGERVTVYQGDLFAPLTAEDTYDVVFWNSNFVDAEPVGDDDGLDRAVFDPGYASHRTFLETAAAHLAPGGRLLLGFCDLGHRDLLERLARETGWVVVPARTARSTTPTGSVTFELLGLVPSANGPPR